MVKSILIILSAISLFITGIPKLVAYAKKEATVRYYKKLKYKLDKLETEKKAKIKNDEIKNKAKTTSIPDIIKHFSDTK